MFPIVFDVLHSNFIQGDERWWGWRYRLSRSSQNNATEDMDAETLQSPPFRIEVVDKFAFPKFEVVVKGVAQVPGYFTIGVCLFYGYREQAGLGPRWVPRNRWMNFVYEPSSEDIAAEPDLEEGYTLTQTIQDPVLPSQEEREEEGYTAVQLSKLYCGRVSTQSNICLSGVGAYRDMSPGREELEGQQGTFVVEYPVS